MNAWIMIRYSFLLVTLGSLIVARAIYEEYVTDPEQTATQMK